MSCSAVGSRAAKYLILSSTAAALRRKRNAECMVPVSNQLCPVRLALWEAPMISLFSNAFRKASRRGLAKGSITVLLVTAGIVELSVSANAEFIVTINQAGSNVDVTGSGSIDLTGLSFVRADIFAQDVWPSVGLIGLGYAGIASQYTGFSGPTSFGPGNDTPAGGDFGDDVALSNASPTPIIAVPLDYASGAALSDGAIFVDETIAELGLTAGTYTYKWSADDLKVIISNAPSTTVPEPLTLSLFAVGAAGIAVLRRRRRISKI
jgi:hypothetical protein